MDALSATELASWLLAVTNRQVEIPTKPLVQLSKLPLFV